MKKISALFIIVLTIFSIFSCKEDDSLAISQDQLLRGNKWQLKEIRNTTDNLTETDKLLACERQSTLNFSDLTHYYKVDYATENASCKQTQSEGTYTYNTAKTKRLLTLTSSTETKKEYYVYQLDPYYLILQDTISNVDTLRLRLQVYEPVK